MLASVAYVALDAIAVIATLVAFSCLAYLAIITYREHTLNASRQRQTASPQQQVASRPQQTATVQWHAASRPRHTPSRT